MVVSNYFLFKDRFVGSILINKRIFGCIPFLFRIENLTENVGILV